MSFTTRLSIHSASPFPALTQSRNIGVTAWRLYTTVGAGVGLDHQVDLETLNVPVAPFHGALGSTSFTINQDLNFFDVTRTDFASLTCMDPSDAGYLFRAGKLTKMPELGAIARA